MTSDIKKTIERIKKEAEEAIKEIKELDSLEKMRVQFLGRKSDLIEILKQLKDMADEEKKNIGPLANRVRQDIFALIRKKKNQIELEKDLEKEWIDVTLPGKERYIGHQHIITKVQKDIENIFTFMGFEIADGPEIESEWYNFTSLNVPADHPARDMQDTFWIEQKIKENGGEETRILPRTQTSNVQVRFMESRKPPFKVIVPGRVYRNEATDAVHEHTFNQFEALVVGKDVSVANFKHIATIFFSEFFGKDLKIRLRPSYFPFTEPSFEFDISCTVCGGKGCKSCKQTGWLEIGGSGMVNQRVFENAGYKRNEWQGFAWGFGIERLAMMKYKIDDIRLFMSGDLRFVRQF
ncbi:MAG: phenylalanine--tRNA ligase subunit alpha [Patescibacteria group bacterium]|nr:phenylalanine--tRNA ligase subunit alpha [Patescibacteria group bacterium]